MRNLRNEVRRIVQEELNSYNAGRGMLLELGDGSAKPYAFDSIGSNTYQFITDSGLRYSVYAKATDLNYLEVEFKANDTFDLTNRGEMYKVMATIMAIIDPMLRKSNIIGIVYSAQAKGNDGGKGRDRLYKLFITSYAKQNNLKVVFTKEVGGVTGIVFATFYTNDNNIPLRTKLLNPSQFELTKNDLRFSGDLDLTNTDITYLPDGLTVLGSLNLKGTLIALLPSKLYVKNNLNLYGTNIERLPDDLYVGGTLFLSNTSARLIIPDGFDVAGNLIMDFHNIVSLPKNLTVNNNLNLSHNKLLTSIPNGLRVGNDLDLNGCTSLKSISNSIKVGNDLNLNGCTSLTLLPNNFRIGGYLSLIGCTSLKALPDGLDVDGLNISMCKSLKTLPTNLKISGNFTLKKTPLARLHNEYEIRAMIEANGGYIKGDIYTK